MAITKNIKKAISNWFYEKINETYKEITKDTLDIFKVEDNYFYEGNDFKQYDVDTNVIALNQYFKEIKYIPTSVLSIVGDRQMIPNVYISDIIVPISMLVQVKDLDMVEDVLSYFSDKTVGETYKIEALYQNKSVIFEFSFSVDLPDFDEFVMVHGLNAKEVSFQLSGALTQSAIYGNNIEYYISYDNGNNYQKLTRLNPTSTRSFTILSDQIIGDNTQKGVEESSKWSFMCDLLVRDTETNENGEQVFSFAKRLLPFIDDLNAKYDNDNIDNSILDNLKFKIVGQIGTSKYEIIKNVVLAQMGIAPDYGEFLTINIRFEEKLADENIPLIE